MCLGAQALRQLHSHRHISPAQQLAMIINIFCHAYRGDKQFNAAECFWAAGMDIRQIRGATVIAYNWIVYQKTFHSTSMEERNYMTLPAVGPREY
jgi:hypothetical protein